MMTGKCPKPESRSRALGTVHIIPIPVYIRGRGYGIGQGKRLQLDVAFLVGLVGFVPEDVFETEGSGGDNVTQMKKDVLSS